MELLLFAVEKTSQRLLLCFHTRFLEMPKNRLYCYAFTRSQTLFWLCE